MVSLPSVILLSIRQHTPCRFSLFNLFVSVKLEDTGDYSYHNFCLKILRIFGWFTRIFAGVSYRKLALLNSSAISASVMQKTVLCLYGILTCLNLHSH